MSACHVHGVITLKYMIRIICAVTLLAVILIAVHGQNEANSVTACLQAKRSTNLCAIDWKLWLYAKQGPATRHICVRTCMTPCALRDAVLESRRMCEQGKTMRELASLP